MMISEPDVSKVQPLKPGETIVLKIDTKLMDYVHIDLLFKQLTQIFPYNRVVVLPSNTCLEIFSKEELIDIKRSLEEYIETL